MLLMNALTTSKCASPSRSCPRSFAPSTSTSVARGMGPPSGTAFAARSSAESALRASPSDASARSSIPSRSSVQRSASPRSGSWSARSNERRDGVRRERLQREDACPRAQRPDDLEGGVLGRRTDQLHEPRLHVGEERVLLRLVPAVDLVDEEHGAATLVARGAGLVERLPQIRDPRHHRGELHEVAVALRRDEPRERRLAAPGRTQKRKLAVDCSPRFFRNQLFGASSSSWPTTSSRVRGRMREASGSGMSQS